MARILAIARGLPGVLYANLELARRLAADGHAVTFASLAKARELVERQGLRFMPLEPCRYDAFLRSDSTQPTLNKLRRVHHRRAEAVASLGVSGLAAAVGELRPDLVLIDGEMHQHIITVKGSETPVALVNAFASIWRRPGLPPAHRLVRPGVGWQGSRPGMSLLWEELRLRKKLRAWRQTVSRVGCDRRSILHQLARHAGFDLRNEIDEGQWLKPFTYRRTPVLSVHAREFEFPHRPLDRVHYVGPMVLASRPDRLTPAGERSALDALFTRRKSAPERRLIYAGFGSVLSTDRGFLDRLIRVIAQRPTWELVLSLSDRVDAGELGPLPDRVHAFSWVPQIETLAHADGCVTHGGINTIDECVLHAVPMLVYCGFETDMAGNTARVVHHGIGVSGDRKRDTPADIRAHLDRVLTEPSFKTNIERLQSTYRAYTARRVAEQTVASLLEGRG